MPKAKGRAEQFRDPDEQLSKDYDPEVDGQKSDNGSDGEDSEQHNAGTEHYETVGKSKIRQKEGVSLGSQYRGARVTREALEDDDDDEDEEESGEDEEFDDPETADLAADAAQADDSEIDSDDALAESDAERLEGFTFRGSSKPVVQGKVSKRAKAADFMSSSDEGEGGGADVEEEEDEDDDEDDEMSGVELASDEDDDMDDGLDDLVNGGAGSDDDSDAAGDVDQSGDTSQDEADDSEADEQTGTKGTHDAKPIMAALSNRADIDKGTAIQRQRKIYDGLLNLRIRLQKALIAANTFPTIESDSEPASEPYEAAEEAAVKLLNTISTLKDNFSTSAKVGDKRKRELDVSMSSEEIWSQLQEEEQKSTKHRDDRLEKWSRKVQTVNLTAAKGLGARNKTLIDVLQEQLTTSGGRLAKRTRVPRSCAPAQAAKKIGEDEDIYDDADFYQQLLKDLVDQRTVETETAQSHAVASVMLTAAKEAKTRNTVDRKASKGRKMRFTVHEKLQNFMAPEDRRSWEQGAVDRFFGALFGRRMQLDEQESEDEDVDGLKAEEEGLRLFRS